MTVEILIICNKRDRKPNESAININIHVIKSKNLNKLQTSIQGAAADVTKDCIILFHGTIERRGSAIILVVDIVSRPVVDEPTRAPGMS